MLTCGALPGVDRALVEAVGGHDGLGRTAIGQQGNDLADETSLVFASIKRCALGLGEGLVASATAVSFFFVTVKVDIVLVPNAVQRAVGIGAKRLGGVQGSGPWFVTHSQNQDPPWTPFLQLSQLSAALPLGRKPISK